MSSNLAGCTIISNDLHPFLLMAFKPTVSKLCPELDDDFRRGMRKVSKFIDEALKQKSLEQEEEAFND